MVKVRMNTADVAAEVKCLRRLIGMRCANVYDLSPKVLSLLFSSSLLSPSSKSIISCHEMKFTFLICGFFNVVWNWICRPICWSLWTVAVSPSPARARRSFCWWRVASDCTLLHMFGMLMIHWVLLQFTDNAKKECGVLKFILVSEQGQKQYSLWVYTEIEEAYTHKKAWGCAAAWIW